MSTIEWDIDALNKELEEVAKSVSGSVSIYVDKTRIPDHHTAYRAGWDLYDAVNTDMSDRDLDAAVDQWVDTFNSGGGNKSQGGAPSQMMSREVKAKYIDRVLNDPKISNKKYQRDIAAQALVVEESDL